MQGSLCSNSSHFISLIPRTASNFGNLLSCGTIDPYALWIPEISHFSRFVEFFSLELFILRNRAAKKLIHLQESKRATINDVIENGPYNSCTICVLFEYERAY